MNAEARKLEQSRYAKLLYRRIPILTWLPRYTLNDAVSDLIAGITVGLTVMPQSLAYATLAGLEPQYGLYSAFAGCLVYVVFGSCKDITIGPTALMSLMTYQQVARRNADFAVLLCFLTGIVQVLLGILHLGVLIDFISIPVTVGFTSATSVIIAVSQLKGLLGLRFQSEGFIDSLYKVSCYLHEARFNDTCLGLLCIIFLLFLRKIKDIKIRTKGDCDALHSQYRRKCLKKILWLISTARNAIVVIISSAFAYMYSNSNGHSVVILTGNVRSGFPPFQPPPFSTVVDGTYLSFIDMCFELGYSIVLVPVIAVLSNVAIAKAFANNSCIDASQEMYSLGLCNIIGSFISSMPVTGSFSRSAVNNVSGVRTPLGGLYTSILIVLSLNLLTPYFYYIPKSSLAAVIICAVIFMIEYEVVKPMWRSSRKDLIPTFATFLACLIIGVEIGILIGVAINIIFLLIPVARPNLNFEKCKTVSGYEYVLVTPSNSLYFPAVNYFRKELCKIGIQNGRSNIPIVIDCKQILRTDFTAAKAIAALTDDFKSYHQPLYFYEIHPDVLPVLKCTYLSNFKEITNLSELDYILSQIYGEGKSTLERSRTCDTNDNSSVLCRSNASGKIDCKVKNELNADVNLPLLQVNSIVNHEV